MRVFRDFIEGLDWSKLPIYTEEVWKKEQEANKLLPPRESTRITASTIHNCQRQLVLRQLFTPEVNYRKYSDDFNAHYGNEIHTMLQDYLMLHPEHGVNQVEVSLPDGPISGRIDFIEGGVINGKSMGQKMIGEIKTVSYSIFSKLDSPDSETISGWQWQMQIYMHYMNIRKAHLVVVRRDALVQLKDGVVEVGKRPRITTPIVKEYWLDYDPNIVKSEFEVYDYVEYCKNNKIIPVVSFSYLCNYCPVRRVCESLGDAEIALGDL